MVVRRVDAAGTHRHAPVVSRGGERVGTIVDQADGVRYVTVHGDAPAETLDALDWAAGADRVRLPDGLVAADGDAVRLVV